MSRIKKNVKQCLINNYLSLNIVMRIIEYCLLLGLSFDICAQSLQKPCCGKIDRLEKFPSKYVEARNIDIWLPENYDNGKPYAVLYMHDGQMLFDPENTWNKQSWDVDETINDLQKTNAIKDVIVVGVWNLNHQRHRNYFPQKPFEGMSDIEKDTINIQLIRSGRATNRFEPNSDDYLKFLVNELKPYIDSTYSVCTTKEHTFMAGSSMGGLISLYAICEYPEVFGGAACLSTHWPGSFTADNGFPESFRRYLAGNLPDQETHRIYFDYGDQTLDALYPPLQKKVDEVMINAGYSHGRNWTTQFFEGKDHSENSWKERFDVPVKFLLGKP